MEKPKSCKKVAVWVKAPGSKWYVSALLFNTKQDAKKHCETMATFCATNPDPEIASQECEWRNSEFRYVEVDVTMPDDSEDAA